MLVLIDLDNTLAERASAVRKWAHEFAIDHGLPSTRVDWLIDLDNDGYSSRDEVFETISQELGLGPASDLQDAYRTRIVELTDAGPGAHKCLEQLREMGHRLAIVSNGSTKQQNAKIDHLEFRSMVDAVIISETVGVKKPSIEIFEIAAKAAEGSLVDALMVGDAVLHDVLGARRLGIRTAWIPRGRSWDPLLAPPDLILEDLATLAGLLPSLMKPETA